MHTSFAQKKTSVSHILTEEVDLAILCYAEDNHVTSLRHIAKQFNDSKSSLFNTLKNIKYKPYTFGNHQQLFEDDKLKRPEFCKTTYV